MMIYHHPNPKGVKDWFPRVVPMDVTQVHTKCRKVVCSFCEKRKSKKEGHQ